MYTEQDKTVPVFNSIPHHEDRATDKQGDSGGRVSIFGGQ